MVLNDFERDAERMLAESGKTKSQVCAEMGVVRSAYYTYIADARVSERYVEYVEALGYDIHVRYERGEGVANDFKADIEKLYEETGYTKKYIAEEMGTKLPNLRAYIRGASVTKGYVKMCSVMGYGIKLEYIPYMR